PATRRAVRKAEKNGLAIEFSQDLDAVRDFYSLLCATRRRHGLPPQPYRFFQNIHQFILSKGAGFVVLARYDRVPIAGAVFFQWGKTGLFKFGASLEEYQRFRANNRVMWEAIRWFLRQGFERLHFGRTSLDNDGLRRFKCGWNADESLIEYVRYDCRQDQF